MSGDSALILRALADIRARLDAQPQAIAEAVAAEVAAVLRSRVDTPTADAAEGLVRARDDGLGQLDQARLEVLLPAINEALGETRWITGEMFAHAYTRAPKLLAALDTLTPDACGKLLRRAVNHQVAGLRVERVRRTHDGVVWRVTTIRR